MNYFFLTLLFFTHFQQPTILIPAHLDDNKKMVSISRGAAVYITPVKGGGHGTGTYVKIGDAYLIITAKHVTSGHSEYFVTAGKKTAIAKKVFESKNKDISVLAVNELSGVDPIDLTKFKGCKLSPGDTVLFSGYPGNYSLMTTRAFISGEMGSTRYLQGLAWFGSSGSGVINEDGKLCGVLTAIGVERKGFHSHTLETLNYIHILEKGDLLRIAETTMKGNTINEK